MGIEWIRAEFGECAVPKVSWQIDAFGLSREVASIYQRMGFDGHVGNRDGGHMKHEFWWNMTNEPNGPRILTTRIQMYNAPKGFDFEAHDQVNATNEHQKATEIAKIGRDWNHAFGSKGHVMVLMGDDNKYRHAEKWYTNLDRLIALTNREHPDVHLFYSTPNCYVKAILDLKPTNMETHSRDYHPFWSGFYTSRPVVKYLIRHTSNLLQAAKQLEVLSGLANTQSLIYEAKNQLAVLQHHDAVTGTSRPFVMVDYRQRLLSAQLATAKAISQALGSLLNTGDANLPQVYIAPNISDFEPKTFSSGDHTAVIVYNPLVQRLDSAWIRVPLTQAHSFTVHDHQGKVVPSSAVPISAKVHSLVGHRPEVTHELVFSAAQVPALGYTTYFLSKEAGKKLAEHSTAIPTNAQGNLVLKGKGFELVIDHRTGSTISMSKDGKSHRFVQHFLNYPAVKGAVWEFCPSGSPVDHSGSSTLVHSGKYSGFSEVTQKVNDWIWQTVRVYEDREDAEFDWTVGPLSEEAHVNQEIVTRFDTDFANQGHWFTDANGRQNIQRTRNPEMRNCLDTHQNVTYNFYPVTSRSILPDSTSGAQLIFSPDRSVGAASLADGQMEFYIHRRIFGHLWIDVDLDDHDLDGHGIVARGSIRVSLATTATEATDRQRQMARAVTHPPVVAFLPVTGSGSLDQFRAAHQSQLTFTGLRSPLPQNLHLLTLETLGAAKNHEILVRFENIYDHGDQSPLARQEHIHVDQFSSAIGTVEHVARSNLAVSGRTTVPVTANLTLSPQAIDTLVYTVKRTLKNTDCGFRWVKRPADRSLPAHAIVAGHEETGGNQPLYICRHPQTDLLPGKYSANHFCHVSYGGHEYNHDDAEVEVLVAENHHYQWVPRHGGDSLPDGALVGGHHGSSTDGVTPIWVGRCAKHGMVVGKVDEYFYFGYGGSEKKECIDHHEVLAC